MHDIVRKSIHELIGVSQNPHADRDEAARADERLAEIIKDQDFLRQLIVRYLSSDELELKNYPPSINAWYLKLLATDTQFELTEPEILKVAHVFHLAPLGLTPARVIEVLQRIHFDKKQQSLSGSHYFDELWKPLFVNQTTDVSLSNQVEAIVNLLIDHSFRTEFPDGIVESLGRLLTTIRARDERIAHLLGNIIRNRAMSFSDDLKIKLLGIL